MLTQCIHGSMDNAFFSWFFSFLLFSILFLAMEKKISWCYPALSGKFSGRYWFLMHLTLYLLSSFLEPSNYIDSQQNLQMYNSLYHYVAPMILISLRSLSLFLSAPPNPSLFPLSHWIYSRNELPNFIVPEKSFLCCPRIFSFYSTLSLPLLVARKRYGRFLC